MRCFSHLQFLVLLELCSISWIKCELYTSVEDLTRWSSVGNKLIELVDERIQLEESKLARLHNVKRLFLLNGASEASDGNASRVLATFANMEHPVGAFIFLNRFLKAIDALRISLSDDEFSKIEEELELPSNDDLIGCGEALLRLQKFYDLDVDDISNGKIGSSNQPENPTMEYSDCFELGKIAYEADDYIMAAHWFRKALEFNDNEMINSNELLEYTAFTAYKNNQLRYAAELTKLWLNREPTNERAIGNLEYYQEELEQDRKQIATSELLGDDGTLTVPNSSIRTTQTKSYADRYSVGKTFTSADYDFAEDDIVRYLCTRENEVVSQNKCTKRVSFGGHSTSPELKIEIINADPKIVRIYDIITDEEANYLRHVASSRLKRSTVQTKQGLVTSNFRIAKTAWLSSRSDQVVDRIEKRIGEILNIDLDSSEDLQVVNYGVGGYYGPHLDSAREIAASMSKNSSIRESSQEGVLQFSTLMQNDRLATVLIYLNHVKAGGSTVFPKLNLTVEPVKRSAIVWYNIMRNGYSDERTLHTGCPVLLGSKWIATKWPREAGNTFLRPCGLSMED